MEWFMDRLIWIVSVFTMIAVFLGCGKAVEETQEAAVERAIEASAAKDGREVDVDLSGDRITMKTEDGEFHSDGATGSMTFTSGDGNVSMTSGAGAQIPDDFPADAPVYAGAEVRSAMRDTQQGTFMVQLYSPDKLDKVTEWVKTETASKGWTLDGDVSQGAPDPLNILNFTKDGRTPSYVISQDGEGTAISITSAKG
jgi:hypothetical protein